MDEQKPVYAFIDTNIWLSFYHYSKDDLGELGKVGPLITQNRLRLLLPRQVEEEFHRNRERKFLDAMKQFKEAKLPTGFPLVCRYSELAYDRMRKAVDTYDAAKAELTKEVEELFEKEQLTADLTIQRLFELANWLPSTDAIVERAKLRVAKGNPPGKNGSLGDAINWECLLETVPSDCEFCIITEDADWRSLSGRDAISPFLRWEWKQKKGTEVALFRRLPSFFEAKFAGIKLRDEVKIANFLGKLRSDTTVEEWGQKMIQLLEILDIVTIDDLSVFAEALGRNADKWEGKAKVTTEEFVTKLKAIIDRRKGG